MLLLESCATHCKSPFFRVLSCRHSNYKWHSFWGEGHNDIILYSVGAYIGKSNIYNSDINATIGSFLTLLRPDQEKINPYYLLVLLNSEFGKQLTRRFSRGMAQQYVYPFDIREFVIPLIPKSKQEEIEREMLDALNAKTQSKHLLDVAKRGVEMAIEKDEQTAMEWINKNVKD